MLYDYSTVTPNTVRHEVEAAIATSEDLVTAVVASVEAPSWDSTMAPLDDVAALMVTAHGRGPFMARVHPDAEVRDAAQEAEERIIKWQSDLVFRRDLYEAVEAFAATDEAAALESERARLLAFSRRDLRRAGHALSSEDRDQVQRLNTRLVELGVAFSRNIDEAEDGIEVGIDRLAGLPESYILPPLSETTG